jgi:MoaA/NifB/PqqE/SkfB family radical SAM enzyme
MNLGGAGEPSSHPNFFEFLEELRLRNINLNIFSHFAYMTPERLLELHHLGNDKPFGLHFIVNISAATANTYAKIRPNQSGEIFKKIISHLKLATTMRLAAGKGIYFTYMSVTNSLNYHEIPLMVYKALETGAHELWIKPIEAHGEEVKEFLISAEKLIPYLVSLKLGLYFSDVMQVKLKHRHVMELTINKYGTKLEEHFKQKNFMLYIKEALLQFPELALGYVNIDPRRKNSNADQDVYLHRFEPDEFSQDNIQNAGFSLKLYDQVPCNIGYEYIRFGVNGEVWPCCISKYPLSQNGNDGILNNWHNSKLQSFRKITENFPTEKLHRNDGDWSFCQQCTHTEINNDFFNAANANNNKI